MMRKTYIDIAHTNTSRHDCGMNLDSGIRKKDGVGRCEREAKMINYKLSLIRTSRLSIFDCGATTLQNE